MKMNEYLALVAYVGVAAVVFIGALIWGKYRASIKRRLNIEDYRPPRQDKNEHHHSPSADF